MKIIARFVFPLSFDLEDAFYKQIQMEIPKRKIRDTLRVIEVYEGSDEYNRVVAALKDFGINCEPRKEFKFSKAEMKSAPLLHMIASGHRGGYPQPENSYFKEVYSFEKGCPHCSFGREQILPIRLKNNINLGKSDISGIWWIRQFIVTEKLKNIIENANLTGCDFWPVISNKTNMPFEGIYQLKVTATLPPMSKTTDFYIGNTVEIAGQVLKICPNGCGEQVIRGLSYYDKNVLENLSDFALTYEWLGSGCNRWQNIYISQKAYDIFKKNKIRGVWFEPAIVLA